MDKRSNHPAVAGDTVSPRQLAAAIGASESSVKRWVDDGRIEAARTAGGHRRIAIAETIRFIRESDVDLVKPEALGLAEFRALSPGGRSKGEEVEALHALLLEGKAAEVRAFVMSLFVEGRSIAWIIDEPVRGAMERLGELWRQGPEGIFKEHRATDLVIQALNALRAMQPFPTAGRSALGSAGPDDPYILPSLGVAAVLESEGWRTVNLGPRTPVRALRAAVEGIDPSLVWVSVSAVSDPEALGAQLGELAADLAEREAMLVVGGKMADSLDLRPGPGLYVGESLAELQAFVRGTRLAG